MNLLITPSVKTEMYNVFYKEMFDFIPYGDSGDLSTTVDISENGILFEMIYASYIYKGDDFNFRKDTHQLSTARWDMVAFNARKKKIYQQWNAILKRRV